MRTFILAVFGLQMIFSTSCLLQTASAQEPSPAVLMTPAPPSAPRQHAGCAQQQREEPTQQQERDGPVGVPGCLGHCLSQATNRSTGDAPVTIPGPPAIVPSFDSNPSTLTGGAPRAPVFSRALSPPQTATVVLRQ